MDLEEAMGVFQDTIVQIGMGMAMDNFMEAMSPGGTLYEQIMAGAIAGGKLWYGMYKPKRYKRLGTLTDRGNIMINVGEPEIDGTNIVASVSVQNISPHAMYAEGFMMVNGEYRRGGDLMGMVPSSVTTHWDAPRDVLEKIVAQAAEIAFG